MGIQEHKLNMSFNYLVILAILIALGVAGRLLPHPPNFTSLLALSFYVPALLGVRYLPALIISFLITDFFIGLNQLNLGDYPEIERHTRLMSERPSFTA